MKASFKWDEAKRQLNLKKHGIDFVDAAQVFRGHTLTVEDARFQYGEQRFVTIGQVNGRTVTVVHCDINESIRIISIRKATRHEQETFFRTLAD